MDIIRAIVSGKKKRYIEQGYDLDLSYITPRIIAMSIPGEGIKKIYRNNLDKVSEFLESKHRNHYLIFNLSGIAYDYEKFQEQVMEFPWEDHYPPPIELLFQACKEIEKWLCITPINIVVVNCRAGKGRTGTLICCYMLYSGRLPDANAALRYYKSKRFKEGGGVTQPSQIRYVRYFDDILKGLVKSPLVLRPVSIQTRTAPHFKNNASRPIFEMYYNENIIYTNKQNERGKQVYLHDDWEDNRLHKIAILEPPLYVQGDILCKIYHWGKFKNANLCRFSFNTGFISYNKIIVLRKYEVDPYKFSKSTRVSDNFAVIIEFEQLCECKSEMRIQERCEICLKMLSVAEKKRWDNILHIVENRNILDSVENLFALQELDDVDKVLSEFDASIDYELLL